MSASKRCKRCGKVKPLEDFYRHSQVKDGRRPECKACTAARRKRWYSENRDREIQRVKEWQRENPQRYAARMREWRRGNRDRKKRTDREGHLKRKFGITQRDYEAMLEAQSGGCAICQRPPKDGTSLHIDHDHVTGDVRGLLCVNCNQGLGQFGDDRALLSAAGEYVEGGAAVLIEAAELTTRARERAASLAGRSLGGGAGL